MVSECLAAAVIVAQAAGPINAALFGWVPVPVPSATSRARQCANYSDSWYVALTNEGQLNVARDVDLRPDPIPFAITEEDDRRGNPSATIRFRSGWLVGFNAGEFGGGLWWFASATASPVRVRPPFDGPPDLRDPYKAENVIGFASVGDDPLVLMGLDHLGGRSGRVFQVEARGAGTALSPWVALDGMPSAWVAEGRSLLVLTTSTIYRLSPPRSTEVVYRFGDGLRGLYPTSMARTKGGQIYIGLRRYVVGLSPIQAGGYREQWLVPQTYLHFRLIDYECTCTSP